MVDGKVCADLLVERPRREDILVSICFSDLPATEDAFATLRQFAQRADRRFRFREIILVVEDKCHESYLPLVELISDLRLLTIRPGSTYYARRVIAAQEAIGDIVLIGNVDEMAHIDVLDLIEEAARQGTVLLATRSLRSAARGGLSTPIAALGRAAGFRVNINDLQTIALPRSELNQLLSHSDPELALRFPPRDPRLTVSFFSVEGDVPFNGGLDQISRRVQLLQRLLVYLAPIILLLVTVSSTLLTLLGIGYAFYTWGAWILVDSLAAGWLTTSAMLCLTATFMGISMLGLSLGLLKLLNQDRTDSLEKVAHEINRIDLFGKVAFDLNVDLERESQQRIKDRV